MSTQPVSPAPAPAKTGSETAQESEVAKLEADLKALEARVEAVEKKVESKIVAAFKHIGHDISAVVHKL